MSLVLKKLKENFGDGVVMMNFTDPVSKHYIGSDILRNEDKKNLSHLINGCSLSKDDILNICSGCLENFDINLLDVDSFINGFLLMLNECCQTYPNEVVVTDGGINTENTAATNMLLAGIQHIAGINEPPTILLESVNTDDLVDSVLSDQDVELLHRFANPKDTGKYRPEYREQLKKTLKDKNSPTYRLLKSSFLRESTMMEAISEIGVDSVADVQNKGIALKENANSISLIKRNLNGGYKIKKFIK